MGHTSTLSLIADFDSITPGVDAEPPIPRVPKSDEARAVLSEALSKHFLFSQLTLKDVEACVDVMGAIQVAGNQDIVVQGENGTRFFVLGEGAAEVRVSGVNCITDVCAFVGKMNTPSTCYVLTGRECH